MQKAFNKLDSYIHQLINQLPTNVYIKDNEGHYLLCNQLYANMLGLTSYKNMIGKTDFELIPHAQAEEIYKDDQLVIQSMESLRYEKIVEYPNGNQINLNINKSPLYNEEGTIIGTIGVLTEISTKKEAQKQKKTIFEKIRNSKTHAFIQQVINNTHGSIYVKDLNGKYLICNQYAANLHSLDSPLEMIDKTDFELPWHNEAHKLRKNDLEVINSGTDISVEETIVLPDGKLVRCISNKAPLRNENGEIIGIIGTSLDITAQKLAEALEKEALEKAIEAEALRERIKTMELLGGSIAHEIRNPLLAIRSSSKIIGKYLPTLIKAYEYAEEKGADLDDIHPDSLDLLLCSVEDINKEINLSNTFIDVLLSKIRNNIDNYELESCSMLACIEEAIKRYPFQKKKHVSLIHYSRDQDFSFHGNQTLMIHVLFNLLKNSLFYIDEAGKGEVNLWLDWDEKFNYLHFKDTGAGMAPEIVSQLFTRFFSQTRYGTGLGLAFCKMVMEGLNGDITCQSFLNEYTEFTLRFPK